MRFHLYIFFTMFCVHSFSVFLFIMLIWSPSVVSQYLSKSDKRGWLTRWPPRSFANPIWHSARLHFHRSAIMPLCLYLLKISLMVGLLHAMAFMVLLLISWAIWNNKPLPLFFVPKHLVMLVAVYQTNSGHRAICLHNESNAQKKFTFKCWTCHASLCTNVQVFAHIALQSSPMQL